jgi:hypothetical protein
VAPHRLALAQRPDQLEGVVMALSFATGVATVKHAISLARGYGCQRVALIGRSISVQGATRHTVTIACIGGISADGSTAIASNKASGTVITFAVSQVSGVDEGVVVPILALDLALPASSQNDDVAINIDVEARKMTVTSTTNGASVTINAPIEVTPAPEGLFS